jgi:hypothetical protein
MPNTARGAFPFPLGGDTPDVVRDITALANRLAAVGAIYVQGLSGARPAANSQGGAGFFYYATDTALLSYSDGAAWHDINPASTVPFLDAPGQVFQEGVLFGGVVTRLDPTSVRVTAGAAWVDGDSIAGFGAGRYYVSWPQTDITGIPAEAGAAQRVDQIILQLTGSQWAGTGSVQRLAGASQAGGTTLAMAARAGAAALPAGSLRIADLLVTVNGVEVPPANNNSVDATARIRDRRQWARGARYLYHANGLADISTSTGSFSDVDPTILSPRLEIATGFVEVELDCVAFNPTNQIYIAFDLPPATNGGANSAWTAAPTGGAAVDADRAEARKTYRHEVVCAPGSYRFNVRWAVPGGSSTATIKRASAYPLTFRVRETLPPNNNNGMG